MSAAAFVVGLNSAQAQSSRDNDADQDTRLSDNSSLIETDQASPLELPQQSYAQVRELEEQRTREAKMKQTAEQFVGAPTVPTLGEQASEQGAAESARSSPRSSAQNAGDDSEAVRAQQLAQASQGARQAQLSSLGQAAETAEQGSVDDKRKKLQNLWRFINGVDTVTAEDVVGAILVVGMMNAQMLNRMTIQNYDLIPEASIPEMFFTTFINIILFVVILPVLLPTCFILLAMMAAIATAGSALGIL